ncbi:unnamed protein product [Malus baccata var. baccata]
MVRFTVGFTLFQDLRFCASTFGAVCGKRHEKLCRFSFLFPSHHHENFTTSTVNLRNPRTQNLTLWLF